MSEQQAERVLGTGAKDHYDTPEEAEAAQRTAGLPEQEDQDEEPAPAPQAPRYTPPPMMSSGGSDTTDADTTT